MFKITRNQIASLSRNILVPADTRMHAHTHTHTHTRSHAHTHTLTHTHTHTLESPLQTYTLEPTLHIQMLIFPQTINHVEFSRTIYTI